MAGKVMTNERQDFQSFLDRGEKNHRRKFTAHYPRLEPWIPVVPAKRETGLCPDSNVGNMVLSEDIGAGDGGKLRPETDIGAFRARRKAWV